MHDPITLFEEFVGKTSNGENGFEVPGGGWVRGEWGWGLCGVGRGGVGGVVGVSEKY